MIRLRLTSILVVLMLLLSLSGCDRLASNRQPSNPAGGPASQTTQAPGEQPIATPLPPVAQTLVSFRVLAPANTPEGGLVYLTILDEVTGLALNARAIPMEPLPHDDPNKPYAHILTLPLPIGSVITYRYERDLAGVRVAEHLSDGSAVRYRMYLVTGQGVVEDTVSRWTDTSFAQPSGRVIGQARDAQSGVALPNLLVSAGGMQTFTASDGSFRLEGMPPGTHNLVAYALDGSYRPFQQGARVAANSTTPAEFQMQAAQIVSVVFVVTAPKDTPPVVPLRMAGNLYGLGNSFSNLMGGMNGLAVNMPVMKNLPDGRYTLTLTLPAGADVRYKYTLGDGFWNAEHTADGAFRLRQLIVPDHTVLIEDKVDTWYDGEPKSLIFDLSVPADTPADEPISIQFNPLIGWTEPLPMWSLGNQRWAYVLFSPLNLPGNFAYRYCRNAQCGISDDVQTPGKYGAGRSLQIGDQTQTRNDQVSAWQHWPGDSAQLPAVETSGRGASYALGVEMVRAYHPAWRSLVPVQLEKLTQLQANWLVLTPTWSYGRMAPGNDPPILAPLPNQDALWADSVQLIQTARAQGLNVALFPNVHMAVEADEWWSSANRADPGWWPVWFEQYSRFILHHADLAAQNDASALVLGGAWLAPALPGGELPDGTPSGVPEDAEERWRGLIAHIRSRYGGDLLWAIDDSALQDAPDFLDAVDQVYLTIGLKNDETIEAHLGMPLASWLQGVAWPVQLVLQKPFILAMSIPAGANMQAQVDQYQEALQAATQYEWIGGFISQGYFPPVLVQEPSASVHGKPAETLLQLWFSQLKGEE